MEIFDLILEESNLLDMAYGSRDDREPPPAERRAQWSTQWSGRKPFSPFGWQAQGFTVGVAESNSEWN